MVFEGIRLRPASGAFTSWQDYLPSTNMMRLYSPFSLSFSLSLVSFLLLLLLFFLPQYYFHYFSRRQSLPDIKCANTKFNRQVKQTILDKVGNYNPPWWYNRHLVAIIQFGKIFDLKSHEEKFLHEDNSNFTIKWYPRKPLENESFRVCIFVPGLGSLSTDVRSSLTHSLSLSDDHLTFYSVNLLIELCHSVYSNFM
jgi:hypothetical protein